MTRPRTDLPTGTVTFPFSDIVGSTGLVQRLASRMSRLCRSFAMFMSGTGMDPLPAARAALTPDLFAAAWERGRQVDIQEVVGYLLATLRGADAGTPATTGVSAP